MSAPITPILTLSDIYGPHRTYIPRAHRQTAQWFAHDAALMDSYTGGQIVVGGEMPIICSSGVATEPILEVMTEAGFSPSRSLVQYKTEKESIELALSQPGQGRRLVVQHVFPTDLLPEESYWIKPALLSYLNNKANLPKLVARAHVAPRTVHPSSEVFAPGAISLPAVIKVATDFSTGAGTAVALCRSANDFNSASERFASATQLVVESFLDVVRNPCLTYVVLPDGSARYLGYSDQEVTEAGQYHGNWFDLDTPLPDDQVKIGLDIVTRAAAMGYRGIAGVDLAYLRDGRVMVLDLNFRVNGSTVATLFAPSLKESHGARMLHLRSFTGKSFDKLLEGTRNVVRTGKLLPLSMFDPRITEFPNDVPRLRALVLGDSRDEILAFEARLNREGLL